MQELEKRLDNIYVKIEKILSLQGELVNSNNKLKAENQELLKTIKAFEEQLKKAEKDSKSVEYQVKISNTQKNQLINKKIDELLSEVEQCMALFRK
jgi:ABC-type uncharacterized transport system auxiliary subunit